MTDLSKIKPSHIQRAAMVYLRQSTPSQVEHNRESTARQYALADKACQLGWAKEQVIIIDEDLGLSGASTAKRSGFARLTSEVALAHVGIVLGLEGSSRAPVSLDGGTSTGAGKPWRRAGRRAGDAAYGATTSS